MGSILDDYAPDLHSDDWNKREGYDVAQICLNGHCINSSTIDYPEHNQDFCSACGQPTMTKCQKCDTPIKGYLRGSMTLYADAIPSFCHKCGAPYPWTASRVDAAVEMANELDGLNDEERSLLAGSVDDLVREGPKTALAATRFKKLITKAGSVAAESFRKILVDIASETAKKMLWPNEK